MVSWRTGRLLLSLLFLMSAVIAVSAYVRYDLLQFDLTQLIFRDDAEVESPVLSAPVAISGTARIKQAYPQVNIAGGQEPLFAK